MGVEQDDSELLTANYIAIGVRCGLSVTETLQIPCGLLIDLWTIYKKVNGLEDRKR